MGSTVPERRHPSIYLLGDHLDAALAMGEDLLTEKVALRASPGISVQRAWARQNRELNTFLTTARTLEYAMTARLLQARKRSDELRRKEGRLRPLIDLFVAGTAPLADAAEELGDTDGRAFDGSDAVLTFLRMRGLVAPDAAGLDGLSELTITEDYLIAGRIRLGTLMDLVATFLDTLDLLFDIFAEPKGDIAPGVPRAREPEGASTEPSPVA
jgi:hypothetical protein